MVHTRVGQNICITLNDDLRLHRASSRAPSPCWPLVVSCTPCQAAAVHMYDQGWPEPYILYIYIYTVYIRFFLQGNYHICSHIRCIYRVLANPMYDACVCV